jgi:hypothetical protein
MSNQTFKKRDRERIRQERLADKLRRREERRNNKDNRPAPADGVDPDIAGIVPGPQPLPEE